MSNPHYQPGREMLSLQKRARAARRVLKNPRLYGDVDRHLLLSYVIWPLADELSVDELYPLEHQRVAA